MCWTAQSWETTKAKGEMRNSWPIYLSEGQIDIPPPAPSLCPAEEAAGEGHQQVICIPAGSAYSGVGQENNFILILQINSRTLWKAPPVPQLLQCSELHIQRMALFNIFPSLISPAAHLTMWRLISFSWNCGNTNDLITERKPFAPCGWWSVKHLYREHIYYTWYDANYSMKYEHRVKSILIYYSLITLL